jgi:hypothetical protein
VALKNRSYRIYCFIDYKNVDMKLKKCPFCGKIIDECNTCGDQRICPEFSNAIDNAIKNAIDSVINNDIDECFKTAKEAKTIRIGNFGNEIYIRDFENGGFTVYFEDFPEIIAEGETIEKAQRNLWDTSFDVLKYLASK